MVSISGDAKLFASGVDAAQDAIRQLAETITIAANEIAKGDCDKINGLAPDQTVVSSELLLKAAQEYHESALAAQAKEHANLLVLTDAEARAKTRDILNQLWYAMGCHRGSGIILPDSAIASIDARREYWRSIGKALLDESLDGEIWC